MSVRRLITWAAYVLSTLLLMACSSAQASQHTITIEDDGHFIPATLNLAQGDSVTWSNGSPFLQRVSVVLLEEGQSPTGPEPLPLPDNPEQLEALGITAAAELRPGTTWRYVFDVPGAYLIVTDSQGAFSIGTLQVLEDAP